MDMTPSARAYCVGIEAALDKVAEDLSLDKQAALGPHKYLDVLSQARRGQSAAIKSIGTAAPKALTAAEKAELGPILGAMLKQKKQDGTLHVIKGIFEP